MLAERFTGGTSRVHRLDPRARLAGAAIFSIVVALAHSFTCLYAALSMGVIMLLAARLSAGAVIRRLLAINSFVLFLWATLPFFHPGETAFTLWGLTASLQGIALATAITLKANAIMFAFIALVATIPVPDMGHALRKLHVPDKLAYLLIFTYRYIFVIAEEYRRMRQALKIRGFRAGTNMHTYKTMAYLAAMVLVRGLDRSERVYSAMLCRGFNGRFRSLNGLEAKRSDFVFIILILVGTCSLAYLELAGNLT